MGELKSINNDIAPIIDNIIGDEQANDYLRKNVSKVAADVIALLKKPMCDDEIADLLDMKINSVRRILNIMQGYGITNYNISKNSEGWLSFSWYVDINKIPQFFDYIKSAVSTTNVLKEGCNDYFICESCYSDNRMILTFDAVF
ncbi:Transcription factor TFIIE, alpha subunit [mine drainage metagenome]|uniref:Transcription factor TFIIE, alpha subunit n=1 Tax=mine drainage metagenome TaxID=410659 RepID=T1DBC4_9ZZZZ